jgi:hypothetical protein
VVSQIWPAFLAGAAAGAAAWQMSAWATDLVKLLAVLAVSGLAYLLTLLVIDGKRMAGDWRWLRQNLKV